MKLDKWNIIENEKREVKKCVYREKSILRLWLLSLEEYKISV